MNQNRLTNENFTDYHIRLFENAEQYGLSSDDIAELLNKEYGSNYSESKWRKDYAQYLRWKDYILEKDLPVTDEISKLTIKKLELQKERNRLSAEKNELNKWIREQARAENIQDKIVESVKLLKPLEAIDVKETNNNSKKSAIIHIADAHYGRQGKIYGLKGEVLAEYNRDVFKERMATLMNHTVKIIQKEGLETITVLNLSDSLDGLIRMSQLQFLQMGVIDATMEFAEYMSQWLNLLSNYVTIEYRSVLGNHTEARMSGANRGELEGENLERIITWFIKERLKNNKNITVYDAEDVVYFNVFDTNILATHGTNEKNLESSVKDYAMMYQVPIHILATGHLHHLNNKVIGMCGEQNIEYIQAPSIAGIDEYSMKLKKTSNAGSLITIIEDGYGKSHMYDIKLR